MLKVHRYSSITRPGDGLGTSRQVMPLASPSAPLVRQKVAQCDATCMPVIHILRPSIRQPRSEEHTSELQSLMRTSYAVFCLKKTKWKHTMSTITAHIGNANEGTPHNKQPL